MGINRFINTCIPIFFAAFAVCQSSNIGLPFINSYPKKTYNAGTQNWDIAQDARGVVYFANNEGMLQYNGKKWKCYPLPNKTIVRSLAIAESGIIYAGGQNELGYFVPDQHGDWTFHSLRELIPENDRDFEDVWDIIIYQGEVIFRTSHKLYCYRNGTFSVLTANGFFNYFGLAEHRLIVQDSQEGLNFYENGQLKLIEGTRQFNHGPVTGFLPIGDNEWIVTTLFSGLYKYDGQRFEKWMPDEYDFILSNRVFSSTVFPDGRIALGTATGGLLILSPEGKILQHLDREKGLLNNKILSMLVDKDHHLWLGLDNGINYVLASSPFTRFSPDGKAEGAGHDVQVFEDKIFFATSNGLFFTKWEEYYSPFDEKKFKEVAGSKGQAWGLDVFDSELLLSAHGGSFRIEDGQAKKNYPQWGVWLFKKLSAKPDLLLAGAYTGLAIFDKQQNGWNFRNRISGFEESSRFIEEDNEGNFWIAHPYKGIYKISLDDECLVAKVKKYGAADGLASDLMNHVFKVNNELIFCSETGIFKYDASKDNFIPYEEFNRIFGSSVDVRRLFEAPSGDIWYVTDDGLGLLQVREKSILKEISKKPFPRQVREQMVGGFEMVYPTDEFNVFIGTENGFIHFDPKKETPVCSNLSLVLDEIICTAKGDSLISKGLFFENGQVLRQQPLSQIATFPPWMNAFRFGFSTTYFSESGAFKYQYRLEGLEDGWSVWNEKSEKEYTNLSPGSYTFHVKALCPVGKETNELTYRFEILPPWYQTSVAKAFYLLIVFTLAAGGIAFFRRKYYKQKEKVVQSEKEIDRLKGERLEMEIAHKNRELVSTTMHLQHKNEILFKINTALGKIKRESRGNKMSDSIAKVIKIMEIEENSEDGWEQFTSHFNEIHPGFFQKLREEFPELSHKDLKLCAYLRMNLSTKEVASLMNNTVRGVEGGRYRLRQKLGLDNKANLTEYILRY